ncbi:MAG: hypothetical protein R2729_18045 [Bryobacteraceae bacterium]
MSRSPALEARFEILDVMSGMIVAFRCVGLSECDLAGFNEQNVIFELRAERAGDLIRLHLD